MNIREIIETMNAGGVITSIDLAYFETHYDAGTMPPVDPAADYEVIDLSDIDMEIDDEMADELAYDAAVFESAKEASVDDGSWVGR